MRGTPTQMATLLMHALLVGWQPAAPPLTCVLGSLTWMQPAMLAVLPHVTLCHWLMVSRGVGMVGMVVSVARHMGPH
jgi:hypothetical protein